MKEAEELHYHTEHEPKSNVFGVFELSSGKVVPINKIIGYPPRVLNRLKLHNEGYCQMFTGVINPNEKWGVRELRRMAKAAESVNRKIGLASKVNDLVIRTRDVKEYNPHNNSQMARVGGTNPMLIVRGINTINPVLVSYGSETGELSFNSLEEWRKNSLVGVNYFLIHEENRMAQIQSIHGRVGWLNDGACEWSLGTNVEHARKIGDPGSIYLKVAGYDFEMGLEMIVGGRGVMSRVDEDIALPGISSNSWGKAIKMANEFAQWTNTINDLKSQFLPKVGAKSVFEFRIYTGKFGNAGLQIYDFDTKLGDGGINTMSGMTPGKKYVENMIYERANVA